MHLNNEKGSTRQTTGVEIIALDYGKTGGNRVEATESSEAEIKNLTGQLAAALAKVDIVLTHDPVYQTNLWKAHVAAWQAAYSTFGVKPNKYRSAVEAQSFQPGVAASDFELGTYSI